MAEPSLSIFGQGTTEDDTFLHISKAGLATKIAEIASAKGKVATFTPSGINTVESIIAAMFICFEAELTQAKRDADSANVQVVVVSSGRLLDSLDPDNESLVYSYRAELYQPINLPSLNPDSY